MHYKAKTSALPPTIVLSVADRPRSSRIAGGAVVEAVRVASETMLVNGTSCVSGDTVIVSFGPFSPDSPALFLAYSVTVPPGTSVRGTITDIKEVVARDGG